jgi:hypothetical protein
MKHLEALRDDAEAAYANWRSYDERQPHDTAHDLRREQLHVTLTLAELARREARFQRYSVH